jgi:hypothetical protein
VTRRRTCSPASPSRSWGTGPLATVRPATRRLTCPGRPPEARSWPTRQAPPQGPGSDARPAGERRRRAVHARCGDLLAGAQAGLGGTRRPPQPPGAVGTSRSGGACWGAGALALVVPAQVARRSPPGPRARTPSWPRSASSAARPVSGRDVEVAGRAHEEHVALVGGRGARDPAVLLVAHSTSPSQCSVTICLAAFSARSTATATARSHPVMRPSRPGRPPGLGHRKCRLAGCSERARKDSNL